MNSTNSIVKWLIAFNIGNVADIISTLYGLSCGLKEANPIIDHILSVYGYSAAILFKLSAGLILSFVLHHRGSHKTSIIAAILVWAVVISNMVNIYVHIN